jgi:hypothetical protein
MLFVAVLSCVFFFSFEQAPVVSEETVYEGAEQRMSSSLEAYNPRSGLRGSVSEKH